MAVQCGWYWGAIGWEEAEKQLASSSDGSFLLRDSSDERYLFSLSFRALNATHHTRVEHYKGQLQRVVARQPSTETIRTSRYAAVQTGRITGLALPSVRPSVPYGLLTRKQNGVEKPKLVSTFPRTGVTNVLIFSLRSKFRVRVRVFS